MDRRTSLKWMMAASATMPLLSQRLLGGSLGAGPAGAGSTLPGTAPRAAGPQSKPGAQGYGTDPDLIPSHHAGEFWPLTLSEAQRRTAGVLCDLILPGDERSPSASSVGVVDFLDEWVSAPYPRQQADRPVIIDGLAWLDEESGRRFGTPFAALAELPQRAICDDICHEQAAAPEFAVAARFFARYRDLTAGGFYTTPEGRRDIGYIGNEPRLTFEGPPLELLRKLGLAG